MQNTLKRELQRAGRACCALLLTVWSMTGTAAEPAIRPVSLQPRLAKEYLNILTTYAIHAKTIWHDAEPGGYWGDGIGPKINANGSVRGMTSTMLTYAMLAYAHHYNWIAPEDKKLLEAAGLTRDELVRYARLNCEYVVAHHNSAPRKLEPQWGAHWQSSLWLGGAGLAAILIWDDLSQELKAGLARVAVAEADRIADMTPKTYKNGDTGAEENGWNTAALALAIALTPEDENASKWWAALKKFSVNTYSTPSDLAAAKSGASGEVLSHVSTANLFNDFTLDNHGFFHPDYVQVSGQHLGEAWIILALGDQLHGTKRAVEFLPYARHNIQHVWSNVLRPLLLPGGEMHFPCGNDWTFHCSTIQSCLAYMATALNDPDAAIAEARGLDHVRKRRSVSPPNRLLGDNNIEWWWEPLVCKRSTTALLHHILTKEKTLNNPSLDSLTTTVLYPDSKVWMHRNPAYLVSASWGKPRMGAFVSLGKQFAQHPYVTIPAETSILPDSVSTGSLVAGFESGPNKMFEMQLPAGKRMLLVALPNSVVWISPVAFRGLAIENDTLTTPGRSISWSGKSQFVPSLAPLEQFETSGTWAAVDNDLLVVSSEGFTYKPAGKFNRKSVAVDSIAPKGTGGVWQMVPRTSAAQAPGIAQVFKVERSGDSMTVVVRDGAAGLRYEIRAEFATNKPAGSVTPLGGITQ